MNKNELITKAYRLFPACRWNEELANVLSFYLSYPRKDIDKLLSGRKKIPPDVEDQINKLTLQRFGPVTMRKRPVLLGFHDYHQPWTHIYYPTKGVGGTLWEMLAEKGVSQSDYLRAFDRRCMVRNYDDDFSKMMGEAKVAAPDLWKSLRGRIVMIVDREVLSALGLKPLHSFQWYVKNRVFWFVCPSRNDFAVRWEGAHVNLALAQRLETLYLHHISG
jgi:hypothetical protein